MGTFYDWQVNAGYTRFISSWFWFQTVTNTPLACLWTVETYRENKLNYKGPADFTQESNSGTFLMWGQCSSPWYHAIQGGDGLILKVLGLTRRSSV